MSTATPDAPPSDATPTPPAATPDTPPADSAPPATGDKDWQAEAEKWKALARKHEDQSKANADKAKRFDDLEEAQKSELQKAAERAEAAEKRAAEIEARALRAEIAAAKGVPAPLLSGSTAEELEASADALLAFRGAQPKPDFGGGNRGSDVGKAKQLTRSDLASMKPQQIEEARLAGQLDDLMQGKTS